MGTALAQFHKAGEDFYLKRQAHRGVFWWRSESSRVQSHLPEDDAKLLLAGVEAFDTLREHADKLPSGVIHGDLFHDNVLCSTVTSLSAILDIYNAATAFWLFDLAIVANDWCSLPDGSIDTERGKRPAERLPCRTSICSVRIRSLAGTDPYCRDAFLVVPPVAGSRT